MRIEQIVGGKITGKALLYPTNKYRCHLDFGISKDIWVKTLEEVAELLRKHPGSSVRMSPDCRIVSHDIYIDGKPL